MCNNIHSPEKTVNQADKPVETKGRLRSERMLLKDWDRINNSMWSKSSFIQSNYFNTGEGDLPQSASSEPLTQSVITWKMFCSDVLLHLYKVVGLAKTDYKKNGCSRGWDSL